MLARWQWLRVVCTVCGLGCSLVGCVSRPYVATELTSYGTLPAGAASKTFGVAWATDAEFPPADRMILNDIAKIIATEAQDHGQNTYFITSDADLKKLMADQGVLVAASYYMNERAHYIPTQTHSHMYPLSRPSGGRVVTSGGGRTTYVYPGRSTYIETDTYTTGGYMVTHHCQFIEISYTTSEELHSPTPQVSYVQKLRNCGSSTDVRKVMGEMLETAFRYLGQEGQFIDKVYTDVPRKSERRYTP